VADRMREEQKTEAEKFLTALANDAATTYGVAPRALLRVGEIGEEIVKVASADADIICVVIGIAHQNNSRGSLASWLAAQARRQVAYAAAHGAGKSNRRTA